MRPPPQSEDADAATRRLRALHPSTRGWTPDQHLHSAPTQPVALAAPHDVVDAGWRDAVARLADARSLAWLLAAGATIVAISVLVMAHRHGSGGVDVPPAAGPPALAAAPPSPAQIVVDVGGRVHHPGLVTLAVGARVADAIAAAGGAINASDIATLDLAARVSDGQLLLIGVRNAATTTGGATATAAPVGLNAATVDQLDGLPGVGPVLAQRIISWRDAHGGFRSIDELQQVPGIGARKYADLKALVVL
jgi:competence protein ComEA